METHTRLMTNGFYRVLLIICFCCTLGIISGCNFSFSKTSEEYLHEAQQLYKVQEHRAAIIALKNSLQKDINNRNARALLGQIYVLLGEAENAEKELSYALELGVPLTSIAFELGDALLMQGKLELIAEIFTLEDSDSEQLRAMKAVIQGEAALQRQKFEQAERYFAVAASVQGIASRALTGQVIQALLQANYDKAEQLLATLLKAEPTNPRAWLIQADLMRLREDSTKAIHAYNMAIKHSQPDVFFYQVAVREKAYQQLKTDDPQKAKESLKQLKASSENINFGDDSKLIHTLAVIAFQDKKYNEAHELAERILLSNDQHLGALLLAGATTAIQGKFHISETYLNRFLVRQPNHPRARKILAYVQSQNQRSLEAIDTLNYLVQHSESIDPEILVLAGVHSLEAGDLQTSSSLLQNAVKQSPEDHRIRFALAENLARMKEFSAAIEQLGSIQDKDAKISALFAIAELQFIEQKYDESIKTLEKIRGLTPQDSLPLVWQGIIFNLINAPEKSNQVLNEAVRLDPSSYPALKTLATLASRSGNTAAAENYYRRAIEHNPQNTQALQDYSNYLIHHQRINEAEKLLNNARLVVPDNTQIIISLTRLYLSQSLPDKAIEVLINEVAKGTPHPAIYAELGNAQKIKGDLQGALSSYTKLSLKKKDSPIPYYLIATVQIALNDLQGAEKSLSNALAIQPDFPLALIPAAQLSLRNHDIETAKLQIALLAKSDPENQALPLLKASLASAEGNFEHAADIYQQLYSDKPTNFILQNLVSNLWRVEKYDEAVNTLNKAVIANPKNSYALFLLASAQEKTGDTQSAISNYLEVTTINNRHYQAYHELATLLKDSQPQKALQYAELAYRLQPDNRLFRQTLKELQKHSNSP